MRRSQSGAKADEYASFLTDVYLLTSCSSLNVGQMTEVVSTNKNTQTLVHVV